MKKFPLFIVIAILFGCQEKSKRADLDIKLTSFQVQDETEEKFNLEEDAIKLITALQKRLYQRDSSEYVRTAENVYEILDKGDQIALKLSGLDENSNIGSLVADIGEISNPTTNILGFDFIEEVFKLAEENLLSGIPAAQKPKPANFLARIIKSPFVKNLLNSTPVGSVVNSIVGSIKARAHTTVGGSGNKKIKEARDIMLESKDYFDSIKVANFEQKLQVYVDFYEGLLNAKRRFDIQDEKFRRDLKLLNEVGKPFYQKYLDDLGLEDQSSIDLQAIFPSTPPTKYSALLDKLDKKEVQEANAKYKTYLALQSRSDQLKEDYAEILRDYFYDVEIVLIKLKVSTSAANPTAIDNYIRKIKNQLPRQGQELPTSEHIYNTIWNNQS